MNLETLNDLSGDAAAKVNDHVEHHSLLVDTAKDSKDISVGTPSFCVIYTGVRPVLLFVKTLLFLKPKWQALITALVAGLDATCNPAKSSIKGL